MAKRFTVGGIEHMVRILQQFPELMALSSLAPLKSVAKEVQKETATCGCNAAKVYQKYTGSFEAALGNLQNGDHLTVKRLLGIDDLCYYVRHDGGQMKLKCI